MLSRSAYREIQQILGSINFESLPAPQTSKSYNASELRRQFASWNQLLEWEGKNPLLIENSDLLHGRIVFWYRMAVVYLKYCPQMWFAAATYFVGQGKSDVAEQFFCNAAKTLPDSLLINFSYAEFEEHNGQLEPSKEVYENLLTRITNQINEYVETVGLQNECPVDEHEQEKNHENFEKLLALHPLLNEYIQRISLVFVNYMRFSRRTEGIKGSRLIFSRARKTFFCTPHIFIAAAFMEYCCTKDSGISIKILELGMKLFFSSSIFIVEYLKFLIILNDDINIRSLFERGIAVQPKNKEFWQIFMDYACKYGDLNDIQNIQKRFVEHFPVEPKDSAEFYASNFKFLDISLREELVLLKEQDTKQQPLTAELSGLDPLEALLKILPLPCYYHGPVIKPEHLCELIDQVSLPKKTTFKKRRMMSDDEDDAPSGDQQKGQKSSNREYKRDLYSSRQQQRRRR